MSLLPAVSLLVLSLLFVRPVADRAWPRRLVLHATMLAACLLTALASGGAGSRAVVSAGLAASLLQLGLLLALLRRGVAGRPEPSRPGPVWLATGLMLVAAALRMVPEAAPAHAPLAVSLAALLAGLLGAVAGRSPIARLGSLILAGDALVLAAGSLPGPGLPSLGSLLLLQAWLLSALVGALAEPVVEGEADPAAAGSGAGA